MRRPYTSIAPLDILGRMYDLTDEDLHQFCRMLYFRRVDYMRFLPFCPWGKQTPSSMPYAKKPNGEYWTGIYSGAWKEQLARLARIAYSWQIALWVEIGDDCAASKVHRPIHPYYNNGGMINGQYDLSGYAQYVRNELLGLIVDTIGLRGRWQRMNGDWVDLKPNKLSLGNELWCRDTHEAIHAHGEFWAYPLAHEMRRLGYKGKIHYSAYQPFAEAIEGYVSSEGKWKTIFRKGDTCRQIHGMQSIEWANEEVPKVIHARWFGVSDDGTFANNPGKERLKRILNRVKVLSEEPFGANRRQRYLDHVELLPLSISDYPSNFKDISKKELEEFSVIHRVFGMKQPNRPVPKWLLKRQGWL